MPRKNSRKIYYENAYYHIYNRGVEKREIFSDRNDYLAFLHTLKTALSPIDSTIKTSKKTFHLRKNFTGQLDLICYCLMPNHYHFLIRLNCPKKALTEFLRSITTSYAMYFNKKYQRVGPLFQGIFKAINITDENYLLWVSRYIHRNPENFRDYPYTSYLNFLGQRKTLWLNSSPILDIFKSSQTTKEKNYQAFVDNEKEQPIDLETLCLEED